MLQELVPPQWRELLKEEFDKPYFIELSRFVESEYERSCTYPAKEHIFNSLALLSPDSVKVVIVGQDPYHGQGQAHGLAFSVLDGVVYPPSLRNIFKELSAQYSLPIPHLRGNLESWATQGVLMLNAVLTVREHEANSHKGRGWEQFTDAILRIVSSHHKGVVYMLWGNYAQKKGEVIAADGNYIMLAAHPSPLSARKRAECEPQFTTANSRLVSDGKEPIDWTIGW